MVLKPLRRGDNDAYRAEVEDSDSDEVVGGSDGSEDDFEGSSGEVDDANVVGGKRARSSPSKNKGKGKAVARDGGKGKRRKTKDEYRWEGEVSRTWDVVREDEGGSLAGAVSDLLLSSKRKRTLRDTASIQRGIIRHVYLVIDCSEAMLVRDFKLPWLDLALQYAQEFVTEFFDQNPISQLGILLTREGAAERLSALSGNAADHLKVLQNRRKLEARGEPSLQNVLELARSGLSHLPTHGSREVIIIFGSLTTCDPGNIHTTIEATDKDKIRVNIIGLQAEMKICKDICTTTKGSYSVARDDLYLRELLFEFVSPPATVAQTAISRLGGANGANGAASSTAKTGGAELMLMGFPTLVHAQYPALCSCHSKLKSMGYTCPRCKSRVCDVPTECRVCGMTVVSSAHLARSFRHLFPVQNFLPVDGPTDGPLPPSCFACSFPFPSVALPNTGLAPTASNFNISPTGRYMCPRCKKQFCLDCDVVIHEGLGVCAGCEAARTTKP